LKKNTAIDNDYNCRNEQGFEILPQESKQNEGEVKHTSRDEFPIFEIPI